MSNHNYDCKNPLANEEKTALCSHIANTDYKFVLSNPKILEIENNLQKRLFLEMVHMNHLFPETKIVINSGLYVNNLNTLLSHAYKMIRLP